MPSYVQTIISVLQDLDFGELAFHDGTVNIVLTLYYETMGTYFFFFNPMTQKFSPSQLLCTLA